MAQATLYFAVLLALLGSGLSLKCIICQSGAPQGTMGLIQCPAKFSNNTSELLQECNVNSLPGMNNVHKKVDSTGIDFTCGKVTGVSGVIMRTCQTSDTCEKLLASQYASKIKSCSSCDTDGCNGTSAISASLPVALLALVMSYILHKQ
ncbi:hypothetical protein O0L34_g379 [Tuta absoluta]|nr:hypothetical protein O0L34_g379 [Tuta absoluta]